MIDRLISEMYGLFSCSYTSELFPKRARWVSLKSQPRPAHAPTAIVQVNVNWPSQSVLSRTPGIYHLVMYHCYKFAMKTLPVPRDQWSPLFLCPRYFYPFKNFFLRRDKIRGTLSGRSELALCLDSLLPSPSPPPTDRLYTKPPPGGRHTVIYKWNMTESKL